MVKGLADKLGRLREKNHYTRQMVAEQIHKSDKTVADYENGVSQPSLETLSRLAAFYKCTTDYLLDVNTDTSELTADMTNLNDRERKVVKEMINVLEDNHKRAHASE